MVKQLLFASAALLIGVGTVSAQRGGGGHAGGGYGGGHGYGGYGGHGGYGRGYYGGYGYGLYGFGYGLGYPYYPYYGGSYYGLDGLGGLGYSSFGGYGSGGYGNSGGAAIVPYSSSYTPSGSGPALDPTAIPSLPAPLNPPPTASAPTALTAASATINVIVPEGGQVWFDNTLSPTKGTKWEYTSPKLEPGKTYTVNVKARWADSTGDKSYDIPLRIVAGDKMTMDLTKIR